jgi:hypothetical protein
MVAWPHRGVKRNVCGPAGRAFVIHDPEDEQVDLDYTIILNDGPLGFTLNGKDFTATEPLAVKTSLSLPHPESRRG